jgi:hypothetical protein
LRQFLRQEAFLLENDTSELAIAHRFAVQLGRVFPNRTIDVNYNRHGAAIKQVQLPAPCRNAGNPERRVFPDIVVHDRGNDVANILVIELKKSTNREPSDCDLAKLRRFRELLGYKVGLFIRFSTGTRAAGVLEKIWCDEGVRG